MAGECRALPSKNLSTIHNLSTITIDPRYATTVQTILRNRRVGPSTPSLLPHHALSPSCRRSNGLVRADLRGEDHVPSLISSNLNDKSYTMLWDAREKASRPCYSCDASFFSFFLWNVGGSLARRGRTGSGMMAWVSSKRTPEGAIMPYRLLVFPRCYATGPSCHHYANKGQRTS
jgi:hypothetical protein